jgi:hypothetical protein
VIKLLVLVLSLCLTVGITAARAGERPVVVELFTSEGCSSCPPADALLAELASRPDVLALSFHVDYWDQLGWKDPFSSSQATQRQNRYATLLHLATVYTPQVVVDGKWEAVGSDRADVEHALDRARSDRREVPVTLALDHGQAQIKLGPGGDAAAAAVLLIGFDRRRVTAVKRGENGGRTLAHVDVVRGVEEIARYSGTAGAIAAPIHWNSDRIAVVLQATDGRVLGVAVSDAEPL